MKYRSSIENEKIEYYRILHRFKYDEEKVNILLKFRNKLTPTGFEEYVRKFFELKGYETKRIGGFNDKKVDVEGIKNEGLETEKNILIQCKRYSSTYVKEVEVSSYKGMISNRLIKRPNTYVYYITTGIYTLRARKFCEENNIISKCENDILEMNKTFPYEEFERHMENKGEKNDKFFTFEQLRLFNANNKLTNKEFLKLLKYIKQDYVYVDKINKNDYLLNSTLNYLSRQNDSYFNSIENLISDYNIKKEEKEKIFRLGEHFIQIFRKISIIDNSVVNSEATVSYKNNTNISFIELLLSFFKIKRIEIHNIKRKNISSKKTIINNSKELLRIQLKSYRLDTANEINKPAFVIFTDKTLDDICKKIPHTKMELLRIEGIGNHKIEKYGNDILEITSQY